ncbi:zinc finger and BTB domain-containing protein 2-like [Paramormyrops kingsleyae]|uniref:Zinc finger and BTB domain containing 2b n=1 Tax=Paramormyrops kingsleyae TaxID=1676925 RepID=A0A3B3SWF3_9TELE|nr:zinc finger and BTB domain-containing protein 2-like [Paramormyrops kingsleyae]
MELANHGLVLLQQLNAQREFGFLCDCTVAIGDVFFKAHKAVLAAFSNYFRMLFIHQDSDCVRLKPADIQPDIFSYLLNLMYTGKLAPQLIDPARLEQGVKFLHAYPLLQEASQTSFAHTEHPLPLAASLYGIQISEQQAGRLASRSGPPSPFDLELLADGKGAAGPEAGVGAYGSPRDDPDQEMPAVTTATVPTVATTNAILHVKPSIMKRGAHFRKHYTCHLCGSRFTQRCNLREHLLLHAPASVPTAMAPPPTEVEETGRDPASDSEQPPQPTMGSPQPQLELPQPITDIGQPQAETPPPSDIADIDNLESGGLDREVKRRRYECNTCGRKFIQKSHWREHMYIHTGKPYKCSACGKSFCRANQAARHVCFSQDRQGAEPCAEENGQPEALFLAAGRPYKCNVCETTFSSPNEVIKHLCFSQSTQGFPILDSPGGMQGDELPKDEGSDSSNTASLITAIKTEEILVE